MAKASKYGLPNLKHQFPNDGACLQYLFNTRHSKECSCGGEYQPMFKMVEGRLVGRKQFQCSQCRFQIAPMAGTIFEKSSTPLTLWFHAIFIFSNAKSGISAKEMERQLNVTYKCAYRILKLIRESLKQGTPHLKGTVEMDDGFFGGKGEGGTYNKNQKDVMAKKVKVIAAIERDGKTVAKKVDDLSANTVGEFLIEVVDQGSKLMTDGSNRYGHYEGLYDRQTVDHGRGEFVRDDVHVNNVESFWSHVKRSIKGTHKSVSKKLFQEYLDAFVWLRNNRGNDRLRFYALLGAVTQTRLA